MPDKVTPAPGPRTVAQWAEMLFDASIVEAMGKPDAVGHIVGMIQSQARREAVEELLHYAFHRPECSALHPVMSGTPCEDRPCDCRYRTTLARLAGEVTE